MTKITSKLQVTIPKAIALSHGLRPGSEIQFESAGESIRIHTDQGKLNSISSEASTEQSLKWFDQATRRQKNRDPQTLRRVEESKSRGWTRADLYTERTTP